MDAGTRQFGLAGFMRQAFLWALLPMLVLFLIAPPVADAQVATNITSSGLNTQVTPSGTTWNITEGTRPGCPGACGPNLFHSFGQFDVGRTAGVNDIANFVNLMNGVSYPTTNILARVTDTGNNPSSIFGTIQTNGPNGFGNANLFLVNPSGFVFGPNGSVNVGGSVSLTTAQYLRLFDEVTGNSANFYANPANDSLANSVLSVAPVVEFGFLSPAAYGFLTAPDPNATITVQGSALSVPSGQSISLVGGKVVIEGGAQLSAPSGRIHLATTASPGEFAAFEPLATATSLQSVLNNPVDPASATSFTSYGLMSLAPGSSIDVSGASTVFVIGGQLVLSVNDATLSTSESPTPSDTIFLGPGSSIVTSNSAADLGADVQMTVGAVQMDGAMIRTINSGELDGGNISINATTVSLTNGTIIESATFGPGRGGDVQVNAGTFTMENAPAITTAAAGGGGVGGDVVLNVETASLLGGALIVSQNQNLTLGGGHGGNVIIRGQQGVGSAAESVTLSGGSGLFTQNLGSSDGGQVAITSKSLTMDGGGTTIDASASDVGRGGDIVLSVQHEASLTGGATIKTLAGSADVNAQPGPTLTVQGLQGAGSRAESLVLSGFGSGIFSDSQGPARAGDVAVHAKTFSLADGAIIQAGTTISPAAGGNVTIEGDSVDISGGSSISSQASNSNAGRISITANTFTLNHSSITTETNSAGSGGDVILNVGSVSLANGAKISSSSTESATGAAGSITIQGLASPADAVTITDSSLLTTAANTGQGGSIAVDAANLSLNNATISASVKNFDNSPGSSDSATVGLGNIKLTGSTISLKGTTLTTESSGLRNAGDVRINPDAPGNSLEMQNSTINTSAALADGGNIGIFATNMVRLTDSIITSSVGNETKTDTLGGNVTIDPQFVILQNSQIRANAFAGAGGAIDIIATSAFIKDPSSIVSASSTLGISGTVNIQSPLQNVGGRLTPLSQQFSSAAALLAQRCAARVADGKFSTFVVAGREGLPVEPGGFLASPSWTAELLGASLSGLYPHTAIAAVTGSFPEFDARPIQLAKFGDACR